MQDDDLISDEEKKAIAAQEYRRALRAQYSKGLTPSDETEDLHVSLKQDTHLKTEGVSSEIYHDAKKAAEVAGNAVRDSGLMTFALELALVIGLAAGGFLLLLILAEIFGPM